MEKQDLCKFIGIPFEFLEYTIGLALEDFKLSSKIDKNTELKAEEKVIDIVKNLGMKIYLDDFGTGYTSLSYLAKMPINLLKVDKSLVDDIEKNEKSQDFVNAVISMGHIMGCEVIAEGTETETQLDILKDQKCDFVQGYVWGKPLEYSVAKDLSMTT